MKYNIIIIALFCFLSFTQVQSTSIDEIFDIISTERVNTEDIVSKWINKWEKIKEKYYNGDSVENNYYDNLIEEAKACNLQSYKKALELNITDNLPNHCFLIPNIYKAMVKSSIINYDADKYEGTIIEDKTTILKLIELLDEKKGKIFKEEKIIKNIEKIFKKINENFNQKESIYVENSKTFINKFIELFESNIYNPKESTQDESWESTFNDIEQKSKKISNNLEGIEKIIKNNEIVNIDMTKIEYENVLNEHKNFLNKFENIKKTKIIKKIEIYYFNEENIKSLTKKEISEIDSVMSSLIILPPMNTNNKNDKNDSNELSIGIIIAICIGSIAIISSIIFGILIKLGKVKNIFKRKSTSSSTHTNYYDGMLIKN